MLIRNVLNLNQTGMWLRTFYVISVNKKHVCHSLHDLVKKCFNVFYIDILSTFLNYNEVAVGLRTVNDILT